MLPGFCQNNPDGISDLLLKDIKEFTGEAPQSDDITLLIIKREE